MTQSVYLFHHALELKTMCLYILIQIKLLNKCFLHMTRCSMEIRNLTGVLNLTPYLQKLSQDQEKKQNNEVAARITL